MRAQPGEERAEKPDADDGDGMPRFNGGSLENVHGASDGLSGERHPVEVVGQLHCGRRVDHVMARVGRRGEERDAIPGPQLVRAGADGDDPSPSLVAWVAAGKRVPEPVAPFPGGEVRVAHAAALEGHEGLPGAGMLELERFDCQLARTCDPGSPPLPVRHSSPTWSAAEDAACRPRGGVIRVSTYVARLSCY